MAAALDVVVVPHYLFICKMAAALDIAVVAFVC